MLQPHAPFGLLALTISAFSAACGGAPVGESSEATGAAVTASPASLALQCNLAPGSWELAEPPQACIGSKLLREQCAAETTLWENLQENCEEPGEVAYFGDGPPKGAFYAWCSPGTYAGTSG